MWTLECDGDLFGGKRLWLRPGQKLIFGRTKPEAEAAANEQTWAISNKSVSRKHLVIDVANVEPGSADNLRARPEIRLHDNSKLGTMLDTMKFKDANVALSKAQHTVKLGSWEQNFIIRWQPVVLTPSMLGSRQRKAADPLEGYRERVEALGIKLSLDYIVGVTTHVVANKRNTPKGLQALINGQHVVTDAYIEAIVQATKPNTTFRDAESGAQAPLETDFEANWPDPIDYLPARGNEPVERSPDSYMPNSKRLDMFSGHTVIFFDQQQLDTLRDVINNGGGKAVLYDVTSDTTDITRFISFVQKLKPQKVVVVRFRAAEEDWQREFQKNSQLALSQRSIEQNEFLDAIIRADIATLKKPLQEEIEINSSSVPPPRHLPANVPDQDSRRNTAAPVKVSSSALQSAEGAPVQSQQPPPATEEPVPGPAPRRKTFRAPYKSRFTGIDDFDPSQITKCVDDSEEEGPSSRTAPIEEEAEEPPARAVQPAAASTSTRKRGRANPEPSPEPEEKTSIVDKLATANERYKRRKLAAGGKIEPASTAQEKTPPKPKNAVAEALENLRRVRQKHEAGRDTTDKDVKEEMAKLRARRNELEEDRLRQEEDLREQIGNADPKAIRDLIKLEEMSISERSGEPSAAHGNVPSDRWDDRWNGRKNFKRFRKVRRGEDASGQLVNQPRKVIVALEETKRKGFGLNDEYWLESGAKRGESGRRTGEHTFNTQQSRSQGNSPSQTARNEPRSQTERPAPDSHTAFGRPAVEEEDEEPEDIEVADGQLQKDKLANNGKRKADASLQEAGNKRRATARSRRGRGDDSSDDELRFKFKKRG